MSTTQAPEIKLSVHRGLMPMSRPQPMRLSEWAAANFYLSAESSYIEGRWEAFPYQATIMDCLSNDDIREVSWIKSARVGYTKIILAAMGYFAQHRKRNQCVWQPVDDDAEDFCKTELDPMIRDVPAVRAVAPWHATKSKNNTLRKKAFIGTTLHIHGGKAAKNYRRISVDVAYLDELDGFDTDIEREGDPVTLAAKRVEGSIFPKLILGSTPKTKRDSMIEFRAEQAEYFFRFYIPCPHCGHFQALHWGGKGVEYGFKWFDDDPHTVGYLCVECAALFTQDQYLLVWQNGRYQTEDGVYIDPLNLFRDKHDAILDTPLSVAFHVWTAYSQMTSWTQIVRDFMAARRDRNKLKTFVNTTLGESWEEDESEQIQSSVLSDRCEHYSAQVPAGVIALTAGIDTQDDRVEVQVDGWGIGEERWSIDFMRLFGDPSQPDIWVALREALQRSYRRADGILVNISLACQDHGGHFSDEVSKFSKMAGPRWLIPIKGSSVYGKPIATFPRKKNKGVYLTIVGTDTAKELLYQRLLIEHPGPGCWHWPIADAFDDAYFAQLTAEERVLKWKQGRKRYVWDAKKRRQEAWDCSVYSLAAVRILQQHMGLNLETRRPEQSSRQPKRGVRSRGVQI